MKIAQESIWRFWLTLLGIAAGVAILYFFRSAIAIVLISFVLALILDRPATFLSKHMPKKSRFLGSLLVYLIILVVFVGSLMTVVPILASQLTEFVGLLPQRVTQFISEPNFLTDFLAKYNLQEHINNLAMELTKSATAIISKLGSFSFGLARGIASFVVNFIFITFLTFFMLLEGPKKLGSIWNAVYINKERMRRHMNVAKKLHDVLANFVTGQLLVSTIAGCLGGIVVLALAFIFGFTPAIAAPVLLLIFVTSFIPMFGATIGCAITVLLLLLYEPVTCLIFIGYYVVYQQIENNIISPRIQAKRLKMSPLVVLFALIVGFAAGGAIGGIVAIPCAGCVLVLVKELLAWRKQRREIRESASE